MDIELGCGSARFRIRWSADGRTVAVIADPEVASAMIDKALSRAAPQGAIVKPAQAVFTGDAPESTVGIVGRLLLNAPPSDEVRLSLVNAVFAALLAELDTGA